MEIEYASAANRIERLIVILAIAGLPAAWYAWGWRGAFGFAAGAIAARFNFRWLRGLVDSLGGDTKHVSGFFLFTRYILFGAAGYVMIKYLEVSVFAAFAGLLIPVGAIFLEVIYEFIYGT